MRIAGVILIALAVVQGVRGTVTRPFTPVGPNTLALFLEALLLLVIGTWLFSMPPRRSWPSNAETKLRAACDGLRRLFYELVDYTRSMLKRLLLLSAVFCVIRFVLFLKYMLGLPWP